MYGNEHPAIFSISLFVSKHGISSEHSHWSPKTILSSPTICLVLFLFALFAFVLFGKALSPPPDSDSKQVTVILERVKRTE